MLKDVVVYVNGGSEDDARLAQAAALCDQHEAHLTALYCNLMPEILVSSPMGIGNPELVVELQREAEQKGDATEKVLAEKIGKLSNSTELRRVDVSRELAGRVIAAEARRADLFIGSRPYPDPDYTGAIFESVLFQAGSACLSVPQQAQATAFDKVLVAWRDTREAALAVSLSLPVLSAASQVILAMVNDGGAPEENAEMPGADMARHLNRHGVDVDLKHISGWSDAGAALLNEAEQTGAELIVMGGYGHSRLREWVLGGVTREIFQKSKVPVLLAH